MPCWFSLAPLYIYNRYQVLKVILSKGEFQLNEDEREHELEAMFRDVSHVTCRPPPKPCML